MKYLCLVYSNEQLLHDSPDSPRDEECFAYGESVQASKLSITDGPFAETKEQLAGFYLVDARDLNEAIQIAGKIPAVRVGSVEVRPVRELLV
ncbi:MAG: YciI family protein [Pseudomonas sp.]